MDSLKDIKVFVAVAEELSFAAAARRLSMSAPTVTRAVSALEDRLGVTLFYRSTRHVRVTDAGASYQQDCRRILDDIKAANASVTGVSAEISGRLSITAPQLFGRMYVIPSVTEFLTQHPKVRIDAVFLDRVVNLLEEGLDMAVRIGHLPDSAERAVKVGQVRIVLCAAPDYIKKYGLPSKPEDLEQHSLISSSPLNPTLDWKFQRSGQQKSFKISPRLTTTSNAAAVEAARSGFGITRLISYQVAPYLRDGSLKTILGEYELPSMPIHIIHRENHLAASKVSAFIDLLAKNLKADQSLN